jgi:membrane protein insertase Oxa1/YidC/SpoIIIJ
LPRDAPLIDLLAQYIKIFGDTGGNVFQQIVNFNKFIIELIDFFLDHALNITQGGFGFSLIMYTFIIKILIFPLFEGQLTTSAKMSKVQPRVRYI